MIEPAGPRNTTAFRDRPLGASAQDRTTPAGRGERVQPAAPVPFSSVTATTGAAPQTPKKDQTDDLIETWDSHPLPVPGGTRQDASGAAAAAETQPCSMSEARSAVTGGAALRVPHPPTFATAPDTAPGSPDRPVGPSSSAAQGLATAEASRAVAVPTAAAAAPFATNDAVAPGRATAS